MGIVSSVFSQNSRMIPDVLLSVRHHIQIFAEILYKRACSADLLAEVLKKQYSVKDPHCQEGARVLPMFCIPWQPHSGQIWISMSHMAFKSSAMERSAYRLRKR